MREMWKWFFPIFILLFFGAEKAMTRPADDSFRCGSNLISLEDTMYEVRNACGEPFSSQIIGERTTYRILKKRKIEIESTVYLTEWIYEGNNGIYVLTFQGSRLVEKEFIFQ